jgi:hypothetical protein
MLRLQLFFAALLVLTAVVWRRRQGGTAWTIGLLSLSLVLAGIHQYAFGTVAEDAFITFRYSMNLAQGHGAVFNAGERVEGYSNFLWMIVLGVLHRAFGLDIPGTARWLGVLAVSATLLLAYWTTLRLTDSDRASGVAASMLLAASGSVAAYGPSGLETPVFCLLVLATACLAVLGRMAGAGLIAGLAVLTRPDGIVPLVTIGRLDRARPGSPCGARGAAREVPGERARHSRAVDGVAPQLLRASVAERAGGQARHGSVVPDQDRPGLPPGVLERERVAPDAGGHRGRPAAGDRRTRYQGRADRG